MKRVQDAPYFYIFIILVRLTGLDWEREAQALGPFAIGASSGRCILDASERILPRIQTHITTKHRFFPEISGQLVILTGHQFPVRYRTMEDEYIRRYHRHEIKEHQCSKSLVKYIKAPVPLVWSLVRRFDQPQKYKPFVSRCIVQAGDLQIGSVRQVNVKSGLPATTSTERLELLDDEEHIFSMTIVGGDHRLKNYSSVITVHPEIIDGRPGTLVIESFVVDVPDGNTKDETCYFVEALIKCNLKSLTDVSERSAVHARTEPIDRI
ncbi:abscisic acid receptor PYL8-like isoform X2 [Juglans microcarpa x Juglans regia]|uniref:abscisic acid receptor PYL8-like isoform X2 n=1 Tax=Juglans microcarpa x Juglans regia TaxID=2249226 RepID=UPI001B7E0E37|nr:abscisic acid receptor PYL8-like isoform X2 [Juglans microcarpa x Juglans regia]